MKCSNCGAENAPNARFCMQCGQELTSPAGTCPHCHAVNPPGAAFCSQCGKSLSAALSAAHSATLSPSLAASVAQAGTPTTPPVTGTPPGAGVAPTATPPASSLQSPPGTAPVVMQTVVGNKNIQINLQNIHGSQLDLDFSAFSEATRLPLPVNLRPVPFPDLLDRQAELTSTTTSLERRIPIEVTAESGLGKTSLLRAAGNSTAATTQRFPAGVIYHRALAQLEPDILQSIFSHFFKIPQNYKPSPEEIRRGLHDLQALVLLDDASLDRDQLTDLRSQAPDCTFVLASTQPSLWGEGKAFTLGGLPPEDALVLFERNLGRALNTKEQAEARQLCSRLNGNPDQLLKAAAQVRAGQAIPDIQKVVEKAPLASFLLKGLQEAEAKVVRAIGIGRGAPVPLAHIAPLAGLTDAHPPLQALEEQHLVQAHSPSYSLTGTLAQELWQKGEMTLWAEHGLGYFSQWTEAQQSNPRLILDSADVILHLLEWAVSQQKWAQVIRLGKAVQAALAVGLRWGAWLQVLKWILIAARALGERSAEGWALHQIGTHAVCVGERETGRTLLTQALQVRQAIGDRAGLEVTQHNLNLLLGPLAPPSQGKPQPPKELSPQQRQRPSTGSAARGTPKWLVPLIGIAVLAIVAIVVLIWIRKEDDTSSTRIATRTPRPPEPSRTLRPTATIPGPLEPEIQFEIDGGCDREYPPGTPASYVYIPNQDGWISVQLDGKDLPGVTQLTVKGNTKSSGDFRIPRTPGEHVLSVFFDLGEVAVTRECHFWVGETIPTTPVQPPASIEFWLDPGWCGNRYAPSDRVYLNVGANRNGSVEFTIRPLFGDNQDAWYPISDNNTIQVSSDQPARLEWATPEIYGNWVLRARLNQGEAEAMCELQISEMNPPSLSEIALVPQLPCENQMVDAFVFVKDESGIETIKLFNRQPNTDNFVELPGNRVDDYSYQFTLLAPQEAGSQFYLEIWDINGNLTSTQADPYSVYSGFISSGIDYEGYCNAYLVWPRTDLYGMDVNYTPPIVDNMVGCMAACLGDLSCQSFTYSTENNNCWLKTGVPAPSACETCTSAKEFTVPIP